VISSRFIEGCVGSGKTEFGISHIHKLITEQHVPSESLLVLVPQRTLGRPYQLAFTSPDWPDGAEIDVVTLGGLARRGLETFWPVVAEKAGFARPNQEPAFLTIETAQFYMARFVNEAVHEGVFDSLNITPYHIMTQTLDNLSKAAVNRFTLDEVRDRLIAAWGDRHSSRPPVYRACIDIARRFREYCLEYNLLDFSLQVKVFMQYLLYEPVYRNHFTQQYHHLVADNLEENFPVAFDFIRWMWDDLETALLIYDADGGYRSFLGADPTGLHRLSELCQEVEAWDRLPDAAPVTNALVAEFDGLLGAGHQAGGTANPREGFVLQTFKFYPQMIDGVVDHIQALVTDGVPPREIVVLAPFLGDSLRFSLILRLNERQIPTVSHRPSRALKDEPAARAVLTFLALAHPEWGYQPPVTDVADALQQTVDQLDPVRARLLAQIVYHPSRAGLGSFDAIQAATQVRITYRVGEKYEHLRRWLLDYAEELAWVPPDHFLSRLFGEVLSQPGYGFHTDLDAGRVVAELVESAYKFRKTLYPDGADNWSEVSRDYFTLVRDGVLAALYVASWREEEKDAVFLAPAYTFLMRNRSVQYQFWLDVGSNHWWERLEQPLTHPYVLSREYPAGQIWTDDLEYGARREALRLLVVGLARRCQKNIFVAISNLGEQGYEQRGPLLNVFQQIIQRYAEPESVE
jgi:hypothetical protein